MERNYKFDNIKVLLIFLVVFGHMLEFCKAGSLIAEPLYLIIYSFHMAAFLFVSGVFAKCSKKHVFTLLFAYLIFQPFYRIDPSRSYTISYLQPQWIMWYIFTFLMYTVLIPFIKTNSKTTKILIFTISVILSLISGYGLQFGYFLSLSRFFVFMPFFISGFYMKDMFKTIDEKLAKKSIKWTFAGILGAICVLNAVFITVFSNMYDKMFYGAFAYEALSNYTIWHRLFLLINGFVWIGFLYVIMPNKKVKFLTAIGSNTLPIYLFHGLIIAVISSSKIFASIEVVDIIISLAFAIILPIIFGNDKLGPIFKKFVSGLWLLDIIDKIKIKLHNKQEIKKG